VSLTLKRFACLVIRITDVGIFNFNIICCFTDHFSKLAWQFTFSYCGNMAQILKYIQLQPLILPRVGGVNTIHFGRTYLLSVWNRMLYSCIFVGGGFKHRHDNKNWNEDISPFSPDLDLVQRFMKVTCIWSFPKWKKFYEVKKRTLMLLQKVWRYKFIYSFVLVHLIVN
jgi:hypothetical protein